MKLQLSIKSVKLEEIIVGRNFSWEYVILQNKQKGVCTSETSTECRSVHWSQVADRLGYACEASTECRSMHWSQVAEKLGHDCEASTECRIMH
jgi:hypothetical protein